MHLSSVHPPNLSACTRDALAPPSRRYRKSASHIVEEGAGWRADSKVKETVEVPAIDFAAWLTKNVKLEDYVVVKMDIEHAEYAVLPRMLATGAACLVDELYLECHSK